MEPVPPNVPTESSVFFMCLLLMSHYVIYCPFSWEQPPVWSPKCCPQLIASLRRGLHSDWLVHQHSVTATQGRPPAEIPWKQLPGMSCCLLVLERHPWGVPHSSGILRKGLWIIEQNCSLFTRWEPGKQFADGDIFPPPGSCVVNGVCIRIYLFVWDRSPGGLFCLATSWEALKGLCWMPCPFCHIRAPLSAWDYGSPTFCLHSAFGILEVTQPSK